MKGVQLSQLHSMDLLFDIKPFGEFSLLVPTFPFVDGCDITLFLHDFSTAGVDFWCEGNSLHGET